MNSGPRWPSKLNETKRDDEGFNNSGKQPDLGGPSPSGLMKPNVFACIVEELEHDDKAPDEYP
jgi:hypothetical protein